MFWKKMTLRTRAILIVSVFLVTMVVVLGVTLTRQSQSAMKQLIDERMLDIVNTSAAMLNGDDLEKLTPEDVGTPEYQAVYNILSYFRDNAHLAYIYCIRDMGNKNFVFGIDPSIEDPGEFGSPIVYTDALYEASLGKAAMDDTPYEDAWGRFYSAFSPVFNSKGEVAGIVAADFKAEWYEHQLNQNTRIIVIGCILFLLIGILVTMILTRQYNRQMVEIKSSLGELTEDLDSLTSEFSDIETKPEASDHSEGTDIKALGKRISHLRDVLRQYINHSQTMANNMITALASDYRVVYYVNLDEDDAVCYRADHSEHLDIPQGTHFSFKERIVWYAEHYVTDHYREGFLNFSDPDNIRNSLASEPIIAYRYLARKEGREYYEMIRMAGVRRAEDRDDHMVHSIGLGFTNIDAEMREAMMKNEALAEALAAAEEANKAKTSFLSSMSHEIRTPMNAIIGLDTLALHEENLSPQTREYLEKIGGSARHLLELINDILDMSRIESGRITLRREEFSFSAMLEQINTMVMSQCSDKGLKYECRLLSRVDDYYIGDDTKLKEVLINILSNAIKFTEAPGSVTLTVEKTAEFEDQSTLRFCVRDTGIGMDKEFIPKIFEAFSQEDGTTKNKYGSTGLGMAITKRIVDMMNGTIQVDSEKGVGTTFTVTVTLKDCVHKEVDRENSIDPNCMHVLVVDDDEIAAEHARTVLEEVGIKADVCNGGAEALRMMEVQRTKQEPYNLVLMDWNMPEMNGLETSEEIRKQFDRETTVVVLTAYNWDDIRQEAQQVGVDSFLAKPLFASNVIEEFERIARRNNMNLFREKKRADLTGRRVLLAEDIELNAEILMDILEIRDVTADHAENGKIAVELFEKSEAGFYSAILMDVRMPEMDGLEAAAAIRAMDREDAKRIPIIALTANAFDEDVQRSLQAGMNAHLTKPVDPDHLYQTMEVLIYEAEE